MAMILMFLMYFANSRAFGVDCSVIAPFFPVGQQNIVISADRFFWKDGQQHSEEICSVGKSIPIYDVRGREEEAYYCLKPLESQIASCMTQYLGEDAVMIVSPASWIGQFDSEDLRSYRFHTYVYPSRNPSDYLDIFARTLTPRLENQSIILEGSKVSGEISLMNEGYWVRVKFMN